MVRFPASDIWKRARERSGIWYLTKKAITPSQRGELVRGDLRDDRYRGGTETDRRSIFVTSGRKGREKVLAPQIET